MERRAAAFARRSGRWRAFALVLAASVTAVSTVWVRDSNAGAAGSTSHLTVPSPNRIGGIAGEPLTITIQVSNSGAGAATQIRLLNDFSQDITLGTSEPGSCSASGRSVSCAVPDLGPGSSISFHLTVFPRRTGTLTDQVRILSAQTAAGSPNLVSFNIQPRPVLGSSVNVAPVSGIALVRTPGSAHSRRLLAGRTIPLGSFVDARRGKVLVRAANSRRGRLQPGQFSFGAFTIRQILGRAPLTELRTQGGSFVGCAAAATSSPLAGASVRRRPRRLWGNARGRFRTRGRYAAATVRGTIWLTIDRCDGTLVIVKQGVVSVSDLVAHRTVRVSAGHSYFAHAP